MAKTAVQFACTDCGYSAGRWFGKCPQCGEFGTLVEEAPAGGAKAEAVAVVDVSGRARPRFLRRFRPPFLAHDVGWAPDGRRVWVSSGDRDEVLVYDSRSRLVRRLAADEPPQHFTFRGDRVYVASGESATLHVHSVAGERLHATRIPPESYNVQQSHGWVVTPGLGTGTVCVLDRAGRVRWRKTVARSSHDACIVTLS